MKKNVIVPGHRGSWYEIDHKKILGRKYFLMEHEQEGDTVPNIVVDEYNNLVCSDCHNGFGDFINICLTEEKPYKPLVADFLQNQLGEGWQVVAQEQGKHRFTATWQRVGLSTKHTYLWFNLVYLTDKDKWRAFEVEGEEIAYGSWYDLEQEEIEKYTKRIEMLLDMGAE